MFKRAGTLIVLALALAATPSAESPFTVIADNLLSPRGLTFGPNGGLLVAQAGMGGNSGRISEIRDLWAPTPQIRDIVTGLISVGDEGEFVGVDGISAHGEGGIYAIMAGSTRPRASRRRSAIS